VGWLTVVAYFAAAWLCIRAARHERQNAPTNGKSSRFWIFTALLLIFLGINKQLDLQSWLTHTARQMAIAQGWYAQRRTVQAVFIAGITLVGIATLIGLAFWLRDSWRAHGGTLTGLTLLLIFICARASSFVHVDTLITRRIGPLHVNWIIELSGIAWIALAAWLSPRKHPDRSATHRPA